MLVMVAGSSKAVQGCAIGATSALPFGVAVTLYSHWSDLGLAWSTAVVVGVALGALFGVVMGLALPHSAARTIDALSGLSYRQRRQAVRATRTGPAPEDPEVLAAALTLVEERRRLYDGWYRYGWVLLGFLVAYSLIMAVTSSPWWWAGVALYGAALVSDQRLRRSIPGRSAVLGRAVAATR